MWDIYPEPYPDLKIFLGYAYALMGDYYELEQALEESAYFSDKETIQNILNAIDEILASDYSEKDIIAYLGWDFPAVNANGKPLYHSSTHGRSSLMYIKKILLQRLVDEPKISEDKKRYLEKLANERKILEQKKRVDEPMVTENLQKCMEEDRIVE